MKYIIELCITFVGCGVVALKKKKIKLFILETEYFQHQKTRKMVNCIEKKSQEQLDKMHIRSNSNNESCNFNKIDDAFGINKRMSISKFELKLLNLMF